MWDYKNNAETSFAMMWKGITLGGGGDTNTTIPKPAPFFVVLG